MSFRLVDYSSDEEQEQRVSNNKVSNDNIANPSMKVKTDYESNLLPVPSAIKGMFSELHEAPVDDPEKHEGKIRSFPHERGMWATYVYILYEAEQEFLDMIEQLKRVSETHGVVLNSIEDFHISVSKTLKLRHHWIQPLISGLRAHLRNFSKFKIMFQSLEVYENEEKTRTFIGLKVHHGSDYLCKISGKVDLCLSEFKLPLFYKHPSFHLSCASCIGSKAEEIERFMPDLNDLFASFVASNPSARTLWASDIHCKSGNKLFKFPLK